MLAGVDFAKSRVHLSGAHLTRSPPVAEHPIYKDLGAKTTSWNLVSFEAVPGRIWIGGMKETATYVVVGATGFEPVTSCV